MTLKISLKPGERMIVGTAVLRNGNAKCHLMVENNVPILREKDILGEAQADSPARRIYFTIQVMYIDRSNLQALHKTYWKLVHEFLAAAPSATTLIDQISEHILKEDYYRALKLTSRLIQYEAELVRRATESA